MIDVGWRGALYAITGLVTGFFILAEAQGVSLWFLPLLIIPLYLFFKGIKSISNKMNEQIDAMIKDGKSDEEIANFIKTGIIVAPKNGVPVGVTFNDALKMVVDRRKYLTRNIRKPETTQRPPETDQTQQTQDITAQQSSPESNNPANQTPPPTPPTV
jgi:hypothetical protein